MVIIPSKMICNINKGISVTFFVYQNGQMAKIIYDAVWWRHIIGYLSPFKKEYQLVFLRSRQFSRHFFSRLFRWLAAPLSSKLKMPHATEFVISWFVELYSSWQKSRKDDGKLLILWFSQFPKFWSRHYGEFLFSSIFPALFYWVHLPASRSFY